MEELLREPETCEVLQVSRATLRRMWADGLFPKPIRIGKRGLRWRRSDIEKFIQSRPAAIVRSNKPVVKAQ